MGTPSLLFPISHSELDREELVRVPCCSKTPLLLQEQEKDRKMVSLQLEGPKTLTKKKLAATARHS